MGEKDQASTAGEGQPATGAGAPAAAPAPDTGQAGASPAAPGPVPYPVFAETNAKVKALEAELAALRPHAARVAELEGAVRSHQVQLGLAVSGASPSYLDYLAGRYQALPEAGRPEPSAWAAALRASEPAFFATVGTTQAAATTAAPRTNPDQGAGSSVAPTTDPPLSAEVIRVMDLDTYRRRRPEIMAWRQKRTA